MSSLLVFTFLFICTWHVADSASGHAWDYTVGGANGPPNWKTHYALCSGQRQSPINIAKSDVIVKKSLPALTLTKYTSTSNGNYTIINNGHTIKVSPTLNNATDYPTITYEGETYELAQFHFHWGVDDTKGSEHTVDGKAYPAEMHLVHWNKKYGNISTALPKADGLLVWGQIFDIDNTANNTKFDPIFGAFDKVMYKDNSTNIAYFPINDLLPTSQDKYFRYNGSLTTPTCDESVTWIVNQAPTKISDYQIKLFRMLYSGTTTNSSEQLVDTFRPVQALNGRKAYSNVDISTSFNFLESSHWDYKSEAIGAAAWSNLFPICKNQRQSPIDIDTKYTKYNESLPTVSLVDYDKVNIGVNFDILNNGHTVQVNAPKVAKLSYAGTTYHLAQFHFHWGKTATTGSEHTVDRKQYQAEVHFVHYNSKYATLGDAAAQSDGLLVYAFFIKEDASAANHTGLKKVFDHFPNVLYKSQTKSFTYFPVMGFIPQNSTKYFTYLGSLTTPMCYESVTWIVNQLIINVSPYQMSQFMTLYKSKSSDSTMLKMYDNYRPVQAMNSRIVSTNIEPIENANTSVVASMFTVLFALIAYCML